MTADLDILDTPDAGRQVLHGGIWRVVGYGGQTLLGLVSFALVTRHLSVGRFGEYTTVISVVTVVGAITDAGMSNLAVREYATGAPEARTVLMRRLLGARLALTTLGVLAGCGFALAAGFDGALVAGTAAAGLGLVLTVVQHMLSVPLTVALRLTETTLLDLARQVVFVATLAVLVAVGAGVLPLLAASIPAGAVVLVLTGRLTPDRLARRPVLRGGHWGELLRLTVPFALASAVGTLYVYMAQVLTDLTTSAHQSGLFAASFRSFIVVGAIPGVVVSAAFPVLARAASGDEARLAYAVDRLTRTTAVLGGAVTLALVVGARAAIDIVAGPRYHGAIGVLQLQAWALLASFVLAGWSFALLSLRRHRTIVMANLPALVISAGLTIALAPSHGARGAAVATLCGETALALAYAIALTRAGAGLRPAAGPLAGVGAVLAAATALGLALPVPAVAAAAIACVVYGAAVWLTGLVPDELVELVRRRGRA